MHDTEEHIEDQKALYIFIMFFATGVKEYIAFL